MTQRFFRRARLGFFHRQPLYGPLALLMQGSESSDGEESLTLAACHHAASWRRDQPAHEALNEAKFDQSRLVEFRNGFAHETARHQPQRGIFQRRQVSGIRQPVHHAFQVGAGAWLLQSDGVD
jgi:hypothetical protein